MHNNTSQGKTMLEGEGNTKGNKSTLPQQQETIRKPQTPLLTPTYPKHTLHKARIRKQKRTSDIQHLIRHLSLLRKNNKHLCPVGFQKKRNRHQTP